MTEQGGSARPRAGRAPSMADVAALAGVSHQTVSRVLNDSPQVKGATRERVVAAIAELGYRRNGAARSLAMNRSRRIGMVAAHLGFYGPSMIASSMQDAAHAAGYELALVGLSEPTSASLRAAVDRLLEQMVEVIVVAAAHESVVAAARDLDLPVRLVLTQGVGPEEDHAVGIDQEQGGYAATAHLLDLGHPQVAHVSGPLRWVEAAQRREGWLRAHAERGKEPGLEIEGDWTPPSGHAAGQRIGSDPSVSAVFAANDGMALGVLTGLHEAGRSVPDDVSVVGFDDIPEAAYFWPPLTTVRQDFASLGARAVAKALDALEGTGAAPSSLTVPALVERRSTAAPRRA
ncbi:LacI family DNA-binding transcriptional regulator [Nocardioides zeae]|uniref:DNA-binding LacI/PurR family transcriptional regulator n=1 Tax=Nocardioides zeae TaxID=1457234 RepID=A0AAJ1TZL0_9ACTN|nr:LacI family DNA-binding transcriptional regulator [Nocardioides zeae]MDQ1102798.1 DNA-binding LacI/PurR family transcriptional regulator [Nocardioides zeae]